MDQSEHASIHQATPASGRPHRKRPHPAKRARHLAGAASGAGMLLLTGGFALSAAHSESATVAAAAVATAGTSTAATSATTMTTAASDTTVTTATTSSSDSSATASSPSATASTSSKGS